MYMHLCSQTNTHIFIHIYKHVNTRKYSHGDFHVYSNICIYNSFYTPLNKLIQFFALI